jgi:hypothetical protein
VTPPKPPPLAPPTPPTGPVLYPSAPSVQVADVSPRRPMMPIDIGPAATGAPPPPPPAASGRGVAPPEDVGRHVVAPDRSERGQEVRPIRSGGKDDFAPLHLQGGASRPPERPTFLDPPAAGETSVGPPSAPDSVFEQTLLPTSRALPSRRQAGSGTSAPSPGRSLQSLLIAATLGLAVAVVILGILLVGGVL